MVITWLDIPRFIFHTIHYCFNMTTSPPSPEVLLIRHHLANAPPLKKDYREERSVSRIRRSSMFHGLIDILST